MGRWAERYTRQQKEAVGSAMLDPDSLTGKPLTAKQAVARLNQGKLGVPAPPEPMPPTTAYDCRNQEKRRRAGHELSPLARQALQDPGQVTADIRQRVLSLYEHQLAEQEDRRARGKPIDLRVFSNLTKNAPVILAMFKPPAKNGDAQKRPNSKPTEPEKPDAVRQLLEASKTQRTAQGTHPPQPTTDTGSAARTQAAGHTDAAALA